MWESKCSKLSICGMIDTDLYHDWEGDTTQPVFCMIFGILAIALLIIQSKSFISFFSAYPIPELLSYLLTLFFHSCPTMYFSGFLIQASYFACLCTSLAELLFGIYKHFSLFWREYQDKESDGEYSQFFSIFSDTIVCVGFV